MMDCEAARTALLEAGPDDVGRVEGQLETHLASCPSCAGLRETLSRAGEGLAAELDALEPRLDADRAVRIATGEERGLERAPTSPAGRRRSGWRWAAVGLAAALVAIAVLPDRRAPVSPPAADAIATGPSAPEPSFAVESISAARFAVFQTRNPRIRVVWLYGSRPAPERE